MATSCGSDEGGPKVLLVFGRHSSEVFEACTGQLMHRRNFDVVVQSAGKDGKQREVQLPGSKHETIRCVDNTEREHVPVTKGTAMNNGFVRMLCYDHSVQLSADDDETREAGKPRSYSVHVPESACNCARDGEDVILQCDGYPEPIGRAHFEHMWQNDRVWFLTYFAKFVARLARGVTVRVVAADSV